MSGFWRPLGAIVRNDLRLQLRSKPILSFLGVAALGFLVLGHFGGVAICVLLHHPPSATAEAALWWIFAFIMLGIAMNAAIQLLYERSDFDFLLSSPVPARAVLLARLASVTIAALGSVALFVPCLVDPAAVFFGPRYLAGYAVWLLLGLATAALGLGSALLLVKLLGARRARTISQVIAAVAGGSAYLAGQLPNILHNTAAGPWLGQILDRLAAQPWFTLPALAGRGALAPLGVLAAIALPLGALTAWLFARTFVGGLQEMSGAPATKTRSLRHRWTGGLWAATFWKDLKLIVRDPLLVAKILPQLVYLVPIAFSSFRSLGLGILAPATYLIAWQLALSLCYVATSGEECWDLIRMSPSPEIRLRVAKLAAGLALPMALATASCAVLLAMGRPVLAAVTWVVTFACASANSWIGVSSFKLVKRTDMFRRRGFRSTVGGNPFVQVLITAYFMITGAAGLGMAATGRHLLISISLLGFALLGAGGCFSLVQLKAIVWPEERA